MSESKAKQKVTLMLDDSSLSGGSQSSGSQVGGSSSVKNAAGGSLSISGCSLGVTNSTVALEASTNELQYSKLSTRSATTSVQFNFDANGAMYRSTTICVEEAMTRETACDVPSPVQPPDASTSCFVTFQPLSTEDDSDAPPAMNKTRSMMVRGSDNHNEDPLTYFSPTVSTCGEHSDVVVVDEGVFASRASGSKSLDEYDDDDTDSSERLDSRDGDSPMQLPDPRPVQQQLLDVQPHGSLTNTSFVSVPKGNPLDPDQMED